MARIIRTGRHMSIRRFRLSVHAGVMIGALLVASTAGAQAPGVAVTRARWDSLVVRFMDVYFAARPEIAVNAGRHEFDGRLPDWSAAGLAAFDSLLATWKARAVAFDTTALDADRRIE